MTTTRIRGEYARSAETRDRILAATLQVAGEVGFRGTSIARIAEVAGVGPGNLYYHFQSREALLGRTAAWVFDRVLGEIAEAMAPVEGYFEREEAAFRAYLVFIRRHPGWIRLSEETRFQFPEQYEAGVERAIAFARDELAKGIERGEVRPLDDVEVTALAHFVLGARYYADLMLQRDDFQDGDDAGVAAYMNLVRGGLEARS